MGILGVLESSAIIPLMGKTFKGYVYLGSRGEWTLFNLLNLNGFLFLLGLARKDSVTISDVNLIIQHGKSTWVLPKSQVVNVSRDYGASYKITHSLGGIPQPLIFDPIGPLTIATFAEEIKANGYPFTGFSALFNPQNPDLNVINPGRFSTALRILALLVSGLLFIMFLFAIVPAFEAKDVKSFGAGIGADMFFLIFFIFEWKQMRKDRKSSQS